MSRATAIALPAKSIIKNGSTTGGIATSCYIFFVQPVQPLEISSNAGGSTDNCLKITFGTANIKTGCTVDHGSCYTVFFF